MSTVIGRNGPMVAYATADPDVALVTDATGHKRMMRLAVLVKFGWIFRADDDPLVAAGTSEGARKAWDKRGRKASAAATATSSGPPDEPPNPGPSGSLPAEWSAMSPVDQAAWAKKRRAELGTPDAEPVTILAGPGHRVVLHSTDTMAMGAQNRTIEGWMDDRVEHDIDKATRTASDDFQRALGDDPRRVGWDSYVAAGSIDINANMRKGVKDDRATQMLSLLESHGVEASAQLFRGEYALGGPLTLPSATYRVGEVYADKAFNSWSAGSNAATIFGAVTDPYRPHDSNYPTASVVFSLKTNGQRVLIGNPNEAESIIPPGTGYKVTSITDHVADGRVRRVIEMEVAR